MTRYWIPGIDEAYFLTRPLLIIKMNREKPLAIVSMEHFFNLLDE
tara:strand:- start:169 stop:303 length:135 start_codon:yes stop_codon:yes gene_type:complete